MKYLKTYNEAYLDEEDEKVAKERFGKISDEVRQKREKELEDGNKKLEDQFPELKTISEESLKFGKDNLDAKEFKKLEKFMDDLTNTEGFKEAMVVLRNLVKELGVIKSLKMIKTVLSTMKTMSQTIKKVRNILPKGEKYNLCFSETNCEIITGGDNDNTLEEAIDKIKSALTPKNLMNILSGKTDELELEYKKMNGDSAEGEIKDVQLKDDGSIEVSIENDNVGIIKKDITEIISVGDDDNQDVEIKELTKKLSDLKTKNPDNIKKISNFTSFISNDNNKDKIDNIYKIIGIQ
jgi:hypothetical protein